MGPARLPVWLRSGVGPGAAPRAGDACTWHEHASPLAAPVFSRVMPLVLELFAAVSCRPCLTCAHSMCRACHARRSSRPPSLRPPPSTKPASVSRSHPNIPPKPSKCLTRLDNTQTSHVASASRSHDTEAARQKCHAPCAIRHTCTPYMYAIRQTPYAIRHTPYAIRHTPYSIRHMPYAICNTPCSCL